MTAAYRLKGIGWFASCVGVVLGFYLVSLQVANERKKLEALNGQIRTADRDIRALETEFDTRANLAQLEKWNGDTLALAAPTANQFVGDERALAAIDVSAMRGAQVETAALVVPSAPAPVVAPVTPAAVPVTSPAVQAAAVQMAAATTKPQVTRAIAEHVVAPVAKPARAEARERLAAVAKVRPQAVAMLDRKLLSDSTLGDILSGARAEAGKRR